MEGRRVEGVFLQHALERSQALEAYKQAQRVQIRILTIVPEIFLETLGRKGNQFRATVMNATENKVLLSLPNGYQIEAENRLSIGISRGDILTLMVEEENPVTLQIVSVERGVKDIKTLIKNLIEDVAFTINLIHPDKAQESIKNSGLFYENKLIKFLTGKEKLENILQDRKYKLLEAVLKTDPEIIRRFSENIEDKGIKNILLRIAEGIEKKDIEQIVKAYDNLRSMDIDNPSLLRWMESTIGKYMEELKFINLLQHFMLSERGKKFAVPFNYEGSKGSLFVSLKDIYRIFFNFIYDEGFLGILMEASRNKPDLINLKFFTDIEILGRRIEREKNTLRKMFGEADLNLGTFEVKVESKENFDNLIKSEFEEGTFHLRV